MERATVTTTPASAADSNSPRRLLCAYSPLWLSGPTPGYKGLCPTWSDEATGEHELVSLT